MSRSTLRSALLPTEPGRGGRAAHRPQRRHLRARRCSAAERGCAWLDCPLDCAAADTPAPPGYSPPTAGPPPRWRRRHWRSVVTPRFSRSGGSGSPTGCRYRWTTPSSSPRTWRTCSSSRWVARSTSCSPSATAWCPPRRPSRSRWSAPAHGRRSGSASRIAARCSRSPASPAIPQTGRSSTPTTSFAPTGCG